MSEIKLEKISTRAPHSFDKIDTKEKTRKMLDEMNDLQNLLYAESKHSLLVILQGLDASGKDGVIRKIFGEFNPQGVMVKSFKTPTEEEASHDFLWRIHNHAPAKGMIQIFNRSHYEDILITRVHGWCSDKIAKARMKAINNWEQMLEEHNGTTILKFYLHVSRDEQKQRLAQRMENPVKMWKFNKNDIKEAKSWEKYMWAYEDCFAHCNHIPWFIIPSDQNWYKEYLVTLKILDTLKGFDMRYPKLKEQ